MIIFDGGVAYHQQEKSQNEGKLKAKVTPWEDDVGLVGVFLCHGPTLLPRSRITSS